MISLITCSRHKELSDSFKKNIAETIGVEYEIVAIDNSTNTHSIFSAYELGFTQSNYPYVCFLHDDVLFTTSDWGTRLINHLEQENTGIVGMAGSEIASIIPSSWSAGFKNIHIIQSDKKSNNVRELLHVPVDFKGNSKEVILLDGVFLAMKREVMNIIKFDTSLKGFHGYDFEMSLQASIAGFRNKVIYDIDLVHFSRGKQDAVYYRNLIDVFKRWENHLPRLSTDFPSEEKENLLKIEEQRFVRFYKMLIRKGLTTKEILAATTYYAQLLNTPFLKSISKRIRFEIIKIRILSCPQYLLR